MKFCEGDLIKVIYIDESGVIRAETGTCDSIIVSMENGQMADVPWFEVWKDGRCVSKWNGAMIYGVEPA